MKKILVGLLGVLLAVARSWADFDEGVVAYAMGQYDKALESMMPLAESANHPYAQYYLGSMYANGQGLKQDFKEAAKWYERAAKQGIPQAQFRLGEIYMSGRGVPMDLERSYAWFAVASHLGHAQAAKALQSSLQRLSPDELAEAKKLGDQLIQQYGIRSVASP